MADEIGCDNPEKSLYLIQIHYLEEQLESCQLKCEELEKQNQDVASKYIALEKDKKDMTEHLKRSLAAKETIVEEVAEQLESQQQAAKQETEALKLQHNQQLQELQDQINELTSGIMTDIEKSEEQKKQQMQLMQRLSDMESLKKQLVSQIAEHGAAINRLKTDLESERKTEEMQKTVDSGVQLELSDFLQKERPQHIEKMEYLQFLLKESVDLRKDRDAQQVKTSDVRVQRECLEKDLKIRRRQSSDCRKANTDIRQWNKALEDRTGDVWKCVVKRELSWKEVQHLRKTVQQQVVELEAYSNVHECMLPRQEHLSQHLASKSEECSLKTAEVGQVEAELQKERRRRRQLEGNMQEGAIILKHILTILSCIKEMEDDSLVNNSLADFNAQDSDVFETQRKLQRLLEVLESTAPRATGSAPKDSNKRSRQRHTVNL